MDRGRSGAPFGRPVGRERVRQGLMRERPFQGDRGWKTGRCPCTRQSIERLAGKAPRNPSHSPPRQLVLQLGTETRQQKAFLPDGSQVLGVGAGSNPSYELRQATPFLAFQKGSRGQPPPKEAKSSDTLLETPHPPLFTGGETEVWGHRVQALGQGLFSLATFHRPRS